MTSCLLFVLLIAACVYTVKDPVNVQKVMQSSGAIPGEYRINSGDQLDIKFFYNSELNEQVTVRPDGRISLQLANDIMAAGLTPAELTEQLKKKYSTEIDKPEITIIVRSFTFQRVFVDGEVYKSGLVSLAGPMTLLQSITQAGGMKDTAYRKGIIVIRRTTDNNVQAMQLNLENAIENSDISQDIVLMPNDIVYVPKSAIANVNVWVDQYIRRNIPISSGLPYGAF